MEQFLLFLKKYIIGFKFTRVLIVITLVIAAFIGFTYISINYDNGKVDPQYQAFCNAVANSTDYSEVDLWDYTTECNNDKQYDTTLQKLCSEFTEVGKNLNLMNFTMYCKEIKDYKQKLEDICSEIKNNRDYLFENSMYCKKD